MAIKSKILLGECVPNRDKKTKSDDVYYPVYINNGEGLTKFYQKALDEAKYDIIVFCHDDIIIETKQVANKIKKLFDKNPEYGILGVAGTKYMAKSGKWWEDKKKMYGRVKHTHNGKSWLSSYSSDLGSNIEEVITVDGLFFSVHRGRLKEGRNVRRTEES